MIHFAQRSSVYLFLALAKESFLQLNSSSAPRRARERASGKEDLRDAVPGEKISDAGREVSGSFLRALFRYPLPRPPAPAHPPPPPSRRRRHRRCRRRRSRRPPLLPACRPPRDGERGIGILQAS